MSLKAGSVPDEPVNVGVDDGYAAVKVAWYDQNGAIRTLSLPSRARSGSYGIGALDGGETVGGYETEGLRFTVAPGLSGETTRVRDYNLLPLARVLVHHALILSGFEGKSVRIGSGLPLDRYFENGKENVHRKVESFGRPVSRLDGGDTVRIVRHQIFPQGLAAVVDWLSDGVVVRPQKRPVGVVDIGGQTTDISVIRPPLSADHRHLATRDIGVLDARELLMRHIRNVYKLDGVSDSLLDEAMETGRLRLYGKETDVRKERFEAIREVQHRLSIEIRSVFKDALPELDAVLFVGGGSLVFRDLPGEYPNGVIPDQPEFSNARGLLKILSIFGEKD